MYILIVNRERDETTGKIENIVSHGVDTDSGKRIVLPNITPEEIGAKFSYELQEWYLPAKIDETLDSPEETFIPQPVYGVRGR